MDRDLFIAAMRCVANSVTVVTTNGPAGQHGATVSAFCSVSADPPTALVCLNKTSRIADIVLENEHFNINILPEGREHVAERFAGRHDNEISGRFSGIDVQEFEGLPAMTDATVLHCKVQQAVMSGSHHIVIADVLDAKAGNPDPLVYSHGTYHKLQKIK